METTVFKGNLVSTENIDNLNQTDYLLVPF